MSTHTAPQEKFPLPPNFANAPGSSIDKILRDIPLPRLVPIEQTFERPTLADAVGSFRESLKASGVMAAIRPGASIAVAAGSRGIVNLPEITRALVDDLKAAGAKPFIFPAMGSHGGATPQGQIAVLEHMGFTEASMGCPIQATMDVVEMGRTASGLPAYLDAIAAKSDGIVVVNRIKPHTSLRGSIESGLLKMVVIGAGKQKGAETCHNLGYEKMEENLVAIGGTLIATGKVLFGVALVENAYHETCEVAVVPATEILAREPELLAKARRLMPRVAMGQLDVLLIDEVGKNISGTGFDPNVVGRYPIGNAPLSPEDPRITRIVVHDITPVSDGNGTGLGMADITTERVLRKFNFSNTYPNLLTATSVVYARLPMVMANDRQAIQAAIKTCMIGDFSQVRLARIKSTLGVDHMEISENMLEEAKANPRLTVTGEAKPIAFDSYGNFA